MKWLSVIALLAALAMPVEAGAQTKSIFRLKGDLKKAAEKAKQEKAEAEAESSGDAADAQGEAGSARRGLFGEREEDETVFPQGPQADEGAPGAGAPEPEGALPGAPAVAEPTGPLPPLSLPRPDLGEAGSKTRRKEPADAQGAAGVIPPRPDLSKPFVYERAPRNVGTVTGYDASVAPLSINIDPSVPAPSPGGAALPPRPMPRLAPYGHSLPPSKTTPPAAIPR